MGFTPSAIGDQGIKPGGGWPTWTHCSSPPAGERLDQLTQMAADRVPVEELAVELDGRLRGHHRHEVAKGDQLLLGGPCFSLLLSLRCHGVLLRVWVDGEGRPPPPQKTAGRPSLRYLLATPPPACCCRGSRFPNQRERGWGLPPCWPRCCWGWCCSRCCWGCCPGAGC